MNDNHIVLQKLISNTLQRLSPSFGEREARAMIREILLRIKGWTPVDIAVKQGEMVSDYLEEEINKIVDRLLNGEPIQYIFGVAYFYGMDFKVNQSTLIPRPETSMLVDVIIKEYGDRQDLRVLDLGTGSGCIAIALARNLRFPEVSGVDISGEAINVAKENGKNLKVGVNFKCEDMLTMSVEPDSYDIIVSNPPYIAEREKDEMSKNVLDYEPASALFVPDDDPLKFYKAIIRIAREGLTANGRLFFEINPLYAEELRSELASAGFEDIEIVKYIDGKDRFIKAKKPEN